VGFDWEEVKQRGLDIAWRLILEKHARPGRRANRLTRPNWLRSI